MAGNIVNPKIVASVCNNGMLGSIPSGYLSLDALTKFIHEVKVLTSKPFIVNIFIDSEHDIPEKLFKSQQLRDIEQQVTQDLSAEFDYPASINMHDYAKLLISQRVAFVSATFGFFSRDIVELFHQNGIKILATVTNSYEAEYCMTNGADGLILQGVEAGGHQGNFLVPEEVIYLAKSCYSKFVK